MNAPEEGLEKEVSKIATNNVDTCDDLERRPEASNMTP